MKSGNGGIVRVQHDKDQPYVVLSKTLTEDKRLSFALRGMLGFLLSKREDWQTHMSHIEASTDKEGREAIRAMFAEGRKFGYIKTVERRVKGRLVYEHTIYERPLKKPFPEIVTADGKPSTVTTRKARTVDGKPSTVQTPAPAADRQREAVNGEPSTETPPLVSNDSASNEEQVIKEREAAAPPALPDQPQNLPEAQQPEQQAADAAPSDEGSPGVPEPSSDQPIPPASQNGKATSSKKVPGGGAARRDKPQTTEEFLRRLLNSKFVDNLLTELQPLGVNRSVDWFALPMARVEELVAEAQRTHVAHNVKVPTRLKDLLDEECRRINTAVTAPDDTPQDEEGEFDMDALIRNAPLHGTARRARR